MSAVQGPRPFDFMKNVFKVAGIWCDQISWSSYRIAYGCTMQLIFSVGFLATMCLNLAFIENVADIAESLYMTLTEFSMMVKIVNLIHKRKVLREFLQNVDSLLFTPETQEEIEIYQKANDGFNKERRIFVVSCWIFISMQYYQAAVSNGAKLPFPGWFPVDWQHSKKYFWTIYTYQVMAMSFTTTMNASFDLMNGYLPFQISVFYRLIASRLRLIGYSTGLEKPTLNRESVVRLLYCIRMHQFVARMATSSQDILTIPTFVQINLSGMVLCFTAFKLSLTSPIAEFRSFCAFLLYMGCMLVEILMPCFYGTEVIIESGALSTSIYSSNWFEMDIRYRKFMHIFMENLKKPVVIKAGGYFSLSLQTLLSVLKGAYSLFALMINIEQ